MTSDTSRDDRVRSRAYGIWESEGRKDGDHDRHWHQANRELGAEDGDEDTAGPSAGDGNASSSGLQPGGTIPDGGPAAAGGRRKGSKDATYGPA